MTALQPDWPFMVSTPRTLVNRATLLMLATLLLASASPECWAGPAYRITFSSDVRAQPFTGRVYLFFALPPAQPRTQLNWFQPPPILAADVTAWKPGEPLLLRADDPHTLIFPAQFGSLNFSGYRVQALARFNPLDRESTQGAGNGFSAPAPVPAQDATVSLSIDQVIPSVPFEETEWTKRLVVRSELLSDFHGRDVFLTGAVTLPRNYRKHPDRHFPTIFEVPGFGGTDRAGWRTSPIAEANDRGVEFLRVMLDPSCPLGHHVFANSANNGPVATALVTEFLPALDREFRSIARPEARFLTGHSSGGWSSLWLQINDPDVFGGVWSTAPDPVDFRDFQRINLYRPGENMYVDPQGNRRPLARHGEQTLLWYDDFSRMEQVLGPGGQLHSFEAVFSPRGADGTPARLWNRESGEIDPDVARAWEAYDIRLVLERNWLTLGPQLAGKIHIFMGEQDTFLLEGATSLLKESLQQLGSDAVVEIHPDKDHGSLMTRSLRDRIRREMTSAFLKHFPEWPAGVP